MNKNKYHKLSIISPLFNEEKNIENLYKELCLTIKKLKHFKEYEIIMINDGSTDSSLQILKQLSNNNKHLKIISFSRNFGHEQATTAGLNNASGNAIVILDADGQHPPQTILNFEEEFIKGFDIVYGQRKKRLKESWLRKLTAKAFYPIFKSLTQINIPQNISDFCMISKKVVEIFNQLPEKKRFVRGLIYWTGLPKKAVPFVCRQRTEGKSKYNYTNLTIFALENIIAFSNIPIYFLIFSSLFSIIGCIVWWIIMLIFRLFKHPISLTNLTTIIIVQLFFVSIIIFCISIIGLYICNAFQEIKNRPNYLINEKINFNN